MARRSPEEIAASKRSASAKRGVATRVHNVKVRDSTERRDKFVANNPERFQGTEVLPGHTTPKHDFRAMNIGVQVEHDQNVPGQQTLPGFEKHPAEVGTPKRWEEMSPREQGHTLRRAAEYGVTPEYLHKSLGAQVDQAAMREQGMGTGKHQSFYAARGTDAHGVMTPRERLVTSAKENNVPFEHQAIANSITSPKQKFVATPKSGPNKGKTVYPNDNMATEAIKQERAGKPIEEIRNPPGMPGFHGNTRKAAEAVRKMRGGATAAEAWQAGPKTGPYHNSWVDPHGPNQYWVSDIHSGGALASHLTQPEREEYLNVQGIHALHDHVARKVADERGIGSLTGMQSMQWSEERRQRGLEDDYKRPKSLSPQQFPGQKKLF